MANTGGMKISMPEAEAKQNLVGSLNDINKVIAVMSGKGGVGKSTITALLASTLAKSAFGLKTPGLTGTDFGITPVISRSGIKMMSVNLPLLGGLCYFSATNTTKKVVYGIANKIAKNIGGEPAINNIDFTLPEARKKAVSFAKEELVLVGVPVYAGRVPNVLLAYLNSIRGNGALAIAVVVYGNRDYDDALIELKDILAAHDFTVIAGAAFIGEHSFSKTLGANRPDEKDMMTVDDFANRIVAKINRSATFQTIDVKGNVPYRKYYLPKNKNGEPVNDFRMIRPQTNDNCIDCKLCAEVCPMGSIDLEDVSKINGICIKCCACIKKCPTQAKYFDDENYLKHQTELELAFTARREPELFI